MEWGPLEVRMSKKWESQVLEGAQYSPKLLRLMMAGVGLKVEL